MQLTFLYFEIAVGDSLAASLVSGGGHLHRLSSHCGRSIILSQNLRTAERDTKDFENGLVFSSWPLAADEIFEVRINQLATHWSGSMGIGLTAYVPDESTLDVPSTVGQLKAITWYVSGSRACQPGSVASVVDTLQRLCPGDVVSVKKTLDSCMKIAVNGNDLGLHMTGLPATVYAVVDLHGIIQSV